MAKTRHQKLHAQMALMAANMNDFFNKLYWLLNQVPRDNYWRHGKAGIRSLSQRTQATLGLVASTAHGAFFSKHITAASGYFSSPSNLKNSSRVSQVLGISRTSYKKRNADFVQKSFYQALLYCCDESELGAHTWFQEEETCDSISHQLSSISAVCHEEFILNGNLARHPYPIFQDAIHAWNGGSYRLSKIESKLDKAISLHEPPAVSTVTIAWKHVKKILREGKHRGIEKFLQLYLSLLEETMFHQMSWSDQQKYYWLKEREDKLFGNVPSNTGNAPGRWQQGNAIDYIKAAKLIHYFVEDFLQNPKNTESGELSCILWLMLWCTYHHINDIRVNDVINLTTDNFLKGGKLKLRGHSFAISKGLLNLLTLLFGTGCGTREKRIFTNIRNEKALTRALQEASKIALGDDEIPITPSAFLHFPHIWPGSHLSKRVRESMRNARHIIEPVLPENYIIEAKKILSSIIPTSPRNHACALQPNSIPTTLRSQE